MTVLIVCIVVLGIAVMIGLSQRQSVAKMKAELTSAAQKNGELEEKFKTSRDELRKSKEELEREKRALKDARDLSKKKLRRLGEEMSDSKIDSIEATMTTTDNNPKAIEALESQITMLKADLDKNEETVRQKLNDEFEKKQETDKNEIEELKKKITNLKDDVKKQKRLMRPEGMKIDLSALPDESAAEFARIYRKAEQHERLHGIARAKLHLAQEKFAELQKRYFSVCRELALALGKNEAIDAKEARDVAEATVTNGQSSNA